MHFLLADDSRQITRLFELWFCLGRHTSRIVSHGLDAVTAVEEEVFDAIVLDLDMPVMDGREALRRIRQLPNGRSAPVAIISGVYQASEMQPAVLDGADVGFVKPLDPLKVMAWLEALGEQPRDNQNRRKTNSGR